MEILKRIASLSAVQRKKLEAKLLEKNISVLQIPIPVVERGKDSHYPVSFGQERLWFIHQLDPGNTAYNLVRVTRLNGPLDLDAFAKSTRHLVERHEILRTVFTTGDGQPRQIVLPDLTVPFNVTDLKGITGEERDERIQNAIHREIDSPFDIEKGPLLRTRMLELRADEHLLILVIHHIVSDGSSIQVFIRELVHTYHAFSSDPELPPDLPPLEIQYIDYSSWQRDWFDTNEGGGGLLKNQETFWLEQFSGELPVLTLPTDFPRPPMQRFDGHIIHFDIDAGITKSLKNIATGERVTLFILLLSVINIFLSRLSGNEDIIIGTPVAGRRHPALDHAIGMFINTLALRNYPQGTKNIRQFLQDVKNRTLKAFENQEYRYEDILEKIDIKRDISRNPLFDVMFIMKNLDYAEVDLPGLTLEPVDYLQKTAMFDLTFSAFENGDTLSFSIEYSTRLFGESTIRRFTGYFTQLLHSLTHAGDLDIPLSSLGYVPAGEREKILYQFNDTAASYPQDKLIHQLFGERLEKNRDRIALTGPRREGRELTYLQFNNEVQWLAGRLIQHGAGPGKIVALMMERSVDMVVAIYSILKAGAAYMPIDWAYPTERINFMLSDSRACNLLTTRELFDKHPQLEYPKGRSLYFEEIFSDYTPHNESPAAFTRRDDDDLAYVMYTSGSTGRPKGVMIEHRSVVNLILLLQRLYPLEEEDTFLFKTPFVFDISIPEIFGWFLGSARLAILEDKGEKEPSLIYDAIETYRVTHINFVPSLFGMFLEFLNPETLSRIATVRYILFCGEALPSELVRRFRRLDNRIRMENIYGPTEATVYAGKYPLSQWNGEGSIPIGAALENYQLYILDKSLRPQGIGIVGELYIGGHGLARGYINNPELTAQQFINSKFKIQNSKLYKTGDLARWLPDGNIEFLGRVDFQVKVRGFRIELDEIESRLLAHENIREVVVTARENEHGDSFLCAFIVSHSGGDAGLTPPELRKFLLEKLPEYMVPSFFINLEKMPLTPNGKADVKALRAYELGQETVSARYTAPHSPLESQIQELLQEIVGVEQIGVEDNFFDSGAHSMALVRLSSRLKQELDLDVPVVTLFQYTSIRALAQHLEGHTRQPVPDKPGPVTSGDIAVIGMALRFPGASNPDAFWNNLKNGVESIHFFSDSELEEAGVAPETYNNPAYVRARAILEERDRFDASFFGYIPAEATVMDPQQRLFHQVTWWALEDAGYNPDTYAGSIGLYAGSTQNIDWSAAAPYTEAGRQVGLFELSLLSNKDFIPTRISYKLNLRGPAVSINTACSTSLVAVHLACHGLINGECDIALAGGVTLHPHGNVGYLYSEGMIMSPDGHCRAFDADAKGTVGGEGAGMVVLKPMERALADRDFVYAVIKGTAINNDGRQKAGFTAPSVEGQAAVIRNAQRIAGVSADSVSYVETHGTATPLGDVVEARALDMAFDSQQRNVCALGSVKTNFGHMDSAAGVAGFIKTVLSMVNRQIPPSLHFKEPNPQIDFENSPFYVNTALRDWKTPGYPLRAGVSGFGIGGTNVHVVLEEAPPVESSQHTRPWQVLNLSARTETALDKAAQNLLHYLKSNKPVDLADVAYTLKIGRKAFDKQLALVVKDRDDAVEVLENFNKKRVLKYNRKEGEKSIVFMFPGIGEHYVNMARELYETESLFREVADNCCEILEPLLERDLRQVIFNGKTKRPVDDDAKKEEGEIDLRKMMNLREQPLSDEEKELSRTIYSQTSVFVIEYAMARLLMSWGIKPHAMIGYSLGEYTAACVSGVFSLEDALFLVASRAKLIHRVEQGAMIAVNMTEDKLKPLMPEGVSLAAKNTPDLCIVSGKLADVDDLEKKLKDKKAIYRRLKTFQAFHSKMMEAVRPKLSEVFSKVTANAPAIPYMSNVTGTWISADEVTNPQYWIDHTVNPIRFSEGITRLLETDCNYFIEIGPGNSLSGFTAQHPKNSGAKDRFILASMPKESEKVSHRYFLLRAVSRLFIAGVPIDWQEFYKQENRRRIPLPVYPFEGRRYPHIGGLKDMERLLSGGEKPLKKKTDPAQWFYLPTWTRSMIPPRPMDKKEQSLSFLLFIPGSETGIGARFKAHLEAGGHRVVAVIPGDDFARDNDGQYRLEPGNPLHYETLLKQLDHELLSNIIHMWCAPSGETTGTVQSRLENGLEQGFSSLLYFAKAMGNLGISQSIRLTAVTAPIHNVSGEEALHPEISPLLGPLVVLPQEYINIQCAHIDLPLSFAGNNHSMERLYKIILRQAPGSMTAIRGNYQWSREFKPIRLEEHLEKNEIFRNRGVYLITGGTGGIGLIIAEFLARHYHAKLALTGRTKLPDPSLWDQYLQPQDGDDPMGRKIRKIRRLEELGAEVLVFGADVSDFTQMEEVFRETGERFGAVNGVIHAAGRMDNDAVGMVAESTPQQWRMQLAPKVNGLLVLDRLLSDRDIDFCLLTSSIASVLGGLGFAAYSAANIFMDSYVHYRNRDGKVPWISVNWDGWLREGVELKDGTLAMTPTEGITAFRRILGWDECQHVVQSLADLQVRIDKWIKKEEQTQDDAGESDDSIPLDFRPELSTPYEAPADQRQKTLVGIWEMFFGIRPVGIDDDFFELGGDSLKAMKVVSYIFKQLKIRVPLTQFFDTSTIRGLAGYLEQQEQPGAGTADAGIQPAEEQDYYLLSGSQKRMYILNQFISYTQGQLLILEGPLDPHRVEKVFRALIERHEALRTSFHMGPDEPIQVIHTGAEFNIDYYDSADYVKTAMEQYLDPFDLTKPPLIRVVIVKLDDTAQQHLMVFSIHHMISDGISMGVLFRDFTRLYAGETLPPLTVRYRDFFNWEREYFRGEEFKSYEKYWLDRFSGDLPILELPTDYPRPARRQFEGEVVDFEISGDHLKRLRELCLDNDSSMFMALMAVFNTLLYRYTNSEDIVVGTIVAGREHAELENLLGVFINILAIRNFPIGDMSFREFLKAVKQVTLDAFQRQSYPFGELLEQVDKKEDLSRTPVFEVMLILQNVQLPRMEEGELRVVPRHLHPDGRSDEWNTGVHAQHDITIWCSESKDRLQFTFEFCTALFRKDTIDRMVGHFNNIARNAVSDPGILLKHIPLMDEPEKQQVLELFNDTAVDFPVDRTVLQMFEEQVLKTPGNIAVIDPERQNTINYSQLDQHSDELAFDLIQQGVLPGDIVAIKMERCIEMYIAVLGVFKSGAAYLPIDPNYPQDRIDYIITDSRARITITDADIRRGTARRAQSGIRRTQSDFAYIIYTSGTTGKPKGVVVDHGNFINAGYGWISEYGLDSMPVNLLQMASFSFDVFAGDLARGLLTGGKIVICPDEARVDPPALYNIIREYNITLFESTPSLIIPLMQYVYENKLSIDHLELLILGSDACPVEDFRRLLERFGGRMRIINSYGLTEATIDSSYYEEPVDRLPVVGNVPIGKPLPNAEYYILDAYGNIQPIGIPGELYIGGKGVARGYLNSPELTHEKYIDSKHIDSKFIIQNSKLYKSGDLCRWLEDGNVEFLGRIDTQVKLRGLRIELGEIESRILQFPGISEAVVLVREDKNNEKYLCAYFVPQPGLDTSIEAGGLRDYLSGNLPGYMVPTRYMEMGKIPLTPNGKVDRKALPEIDDITGAEYIPPQNPTEEKLVGLWAEVLGMDADSISMEDNFFHLGGQSILAMRLIGLIRDTFNVNVPLARFFQIAALRGLARLIMEKERLEEKVLTVEEAGFLRPFELDKSPLLRASLVKLPDQRHLFFVAMHHIITDDFSMDLIRREFFKLYSASPQTDPLPPQTLQYKDFSHWQEQFFKSERFREHEKYWLAVYKEPVPRLELPLDFPRPDKPGTEGKTIQFPVPSDLEAQIRQLTAQQEATLFMFFSAVYSLLLSKLCRQEDVVIGVPASGRTHADSTGILGFFVNTLALRFHVNAEIPFYRYLDAVKRHIMASLENQDYPFQFLVEKLNLSGEYGRNPLFDTMFTLANFDEEEVRSGDDTLKVSPFLYDTGRVLFDLVMGVLVTPKDIRLSFTFNTALFKEETISQFAQQFIELLENITAAPESSIGSMLHYNLPVELPIEAGEPLEQNYNIDPEQEAYWLKQFENPVPVLALPADYRKPAVQESCDGTLDFHIPPDTQQKLLKIASGENVTLFNLLLAALNAWLHRLTGQEDIVIGATVQGSGNINNTLPLRNSPVDGKTFLLFLREVSANTSAALENRYYPFDYLVKKLNLTNNSGGNPLFDIMLQLYDDTEEAHELNDELNDELNNTQCDITLNAVKAKEEIRFSITYRTGLFEEETIQRYAGYFTTAVVSLMENPGIDLRDVRVLPSIEKKELLYDFNNFTHSYAADKTVMQLFEEQAERTPDKNAVVSASETLTFRQLNEQSNRLARILRQRGIKPNSVVGIMMERSPRFIITLYAILKAGGAYLPIDPSYPEQRITGMMNDSKAAVLIVDDVGNINSGTPDSKNIKTGAQQLLSYGEIQPQLTGMSPGNLEPVHQPDHMMYIIFTSGSTGVPKGAGVYHRGFVNLMNWFIAEYRLDENDSNVLMTSSSFDLTQKNFYTSPLCGGVLHIPSVNHFDILEMAKILEENNVTWINCTPSMFLQLIEYSGGDRYRQLQSLRYVYLGGEPLPVGHYMNWLQSENCHAKIVNTYGPTECTDISNAYVIEEPGRFIDTAVPIGKPIYNVQLYVLDHHLRLQPIGFPGELCIGGDSIGIGYINDKQLTQEKFINIKLPEQENGSLTPGSERMVQVYRTGDLVKWLPDGTIEFIGRLDNQVKIRGLRIELGEIENILLAHPQVSEAAAAVRQDEKGNKFLAAYIVSNGDMNTSDIQEHLSRKLPDYMVPSTYTRLDKMPLTPSGKLDRRALPETGMNLKQGAPYVKPRTPEEQQLAHLWSETLNIHLIGIDDNFFQLGGDSLRAYLLLAKINRQFQIQAVLNHLFAAPTVRTFAESLSLSTGEGILGISPVEEREYYPASPAQERLYVLNRLDSGDTGYNVYMSMLMNGGLDRSRLTQAVEKLVQRHEVLRTGFEMQEGKVVQRVYKKPAFQLDFLEVANDSRTGDNIDNEYIENIIKGNIPVKEDVINPDPDDSVSSLSEVKLKKVKRKRKEIKL